MLRLRKVTIGKETGYFHKWVVLNNKLLAVCETMDGRVRLDEYVDIKFDRVLKENLVRHD